MTIQAVCRPIYEKVTIEPMKEDDLDQVMAIEKASFHRPWTSGQFKTELERRPAVCLVVRDGPEILGHLIFWLIPPDIHILNIAVKPAFRRQGLGRLLLDYLFALGLETGVKEVFLEVRPSNLSALNLYLQADFVQTGRRRNYYSEDREDALLMTKVLP